MGRISLFCRLALALAALSVALPRPAVCASPGAPLIKMLQSGRVAADRAGSVVEMIGKRGDADDLAFLLQNAVAGDWNETLRGQALAVLAEASTTRGLRPTGDLTVLEKLLPPDQQPKQDPTRQLLAIRLAGMWRVAPLAEPLARLTLDDQAPVSVRRASAIALGQIGGPAAEKTFATLLAADRPTPIRGLGVAGLAQADLAAAAQKGAEVLAGQSADDNPAALIDVFISHTKGGDRLAEALRKTMPPAAVAQHALEHLYAIGRVDGDLPVALGEIAGISSDMHLPDQEEVRRLVAEVQAEGNAERGEAVFRRANLSCMKCHSISGAGGNVGPDLSAVGNISPIEFLITSVLAPDLAVKEAFLSAVVQTSEGNTFQGIVLQENSDLIVLKDSQGIEIKIPRDGEEQIKKGGSLMPKGLVNLMSHADFLDLVRFLSELGKPGPFGLRTAGTIQRWRFLTPVPKSALAADSAKLPAEVAAADSSAWQPAYGKVAGMLPLDAIAAAAGSPVVFLKAQVQVAEPGQVDAKLNSADGLSLWVDGQPRDVATGSLGELPPGKHELLFRVDTAHRPMSELRVELVRPQKSPAEFTVVDGT